MLFFQSFDEMVERTRIEARPESCGHDAIKIGNKMRYDIDFEKNDAEQVNEFRQKSILLEYNIFKTYVTV